MIDTILRKFIEADESKSVSDVPLDENHQLHI